MSEMRLLFVVAVFVFVVACVARGIAADRNVTLRTPWWEYALSGLVLAAVAVMMFVIATPAMANVVRCPNGVWVPGPGCQRCPDGSWISTSQQCYRAPGGQWVGTPKPQPPEYEWERKRRGARDWDTDNPWNPRRPE